MRRGGGDVRSQSSPLSDIIAEARRLTAAAQQAGTALKLAGGLGVYFHSPSTRSAPLHREYRDLDFVAPSEQREAIQPLLESLGYEPDVPFNTLHGHRRLHYWDVQHRRQVDIFLDQIRMCHVIDLRARLDLPDAVLAPADLLLTKMQIVEINMKDLVDVVALLLDHPTADGDADTINRSYIAALVGRDWGLYRTLKLNSGRVLGVLPHLEVAADVVRRRLEELWQAIETRPKSLAWRIRARIGDRVRWYEIPEEAGSAG